LFQFCQAWQAEGFQMGKMSKRKGAAGELEAAAKLNEVLGTHLRRGRQYHGGPESPDVTGDLPGLHVEVKRTERLRLWEAVDQARRDAAVDQVPVVMHRANKKPWVVIVEVELLIRLLDVVDEARVRLDEVEAPTGQTAGVAQEAADAVS
jgi:hypothetical protein